MAAPSTSARWNAAAGVEPALITAANQFPPDLFNGQLTPQDLFSNAYGQQNVYNFLGRLHNDPATFGIPFEQARNVRRLIHKFFFYNYTAVQLNANGGNIPTSALTSTDFAVVAPMWIRFVTIGGLYHASPVYIDLQEVLPEKRWLGIVDYGSALGYIFSVCRSTVAIAPDNLAVDNYALPRLTMYSTFLAKATRLPGRRPNRKFYPRMTCGMYVTQAPAGSPQRAGILLLGSTMVDGAIAGGRNPATGQNAKAIGQDYRERILREIRPLALIPPVQEAAIVFDIKAALAGNVEVATTNWNRALAVLPTYQVTDARGAAPVTTTAGALSLDAAWIQQKWVAPATRLAQGEFDADITAFARRIWRDMQGVALPAGQPGGAILPYFGDPALGGLTIAQACDAFRNRILTGRRPKIVNFADSTLRVTVPGGTILAWDWEEFGFPQNTDPLAAPASKISSIVEINRLITRFNNIGLGDGQAYGHCAESYPFIYWERVFRRHGVIPAGPITDTTPLNRQLESWSIDLDILQGWISNPAARDLIFLRPSMKDCVMDSSNKPTLSILRDPCNNCKSLARAFRNDDERMNSFCRTLQVIYGRMPVAAPRPPWTMKYPPFLRDYRPVW